MFTAVARFAIRPISPGPISLEGPDLTKISVIIPAYNEATTIAGVVQSALETECVGQVIVVSDGSTDATAEAAEVAGATVLKHPTNRGKAAAMKTGLLAAQHETLLFLDADLIGLGTAHVTALAAPVLEGRADIAVGVMCDGRAATDFAQAVAPFLSGMRAGRVEAFEPLRTLDEAGWGAEVALTLWARERRMRVQEVRVSGVTQRMKEEKIGFAKGFAARLRMYWDILRMVPRGERARR